MAKQSTSSSLALSYIHVRLQTLQEEHQWLLKQIKRKRKELENFVEQMRSVATDIFQRCHPQIQKLADIDREIHTLFDEILTRRKLGKQSKKDIEAIYNQLQFARIISFKPTKTDREEEPELDEIFGNQDSEENFDQTYQQAYQQYEAAPSDVDSIPGKKSDISRKIRETFLSLAEIFHPDKVKDSETQKRHTEIMKEINKAYQEGDLARLLEIEQQYQVGQYVDINNEDELTRKCNQITQQNEILKNQYEAIKKELRLVKKTPEGAMVSDCRKASKEGIDAIGRMVEQVESEIRNIAIIRDFVKDFREQKITIKEFLSGPVNLGYMYEDTEEDDLEEMFFELGEVMFF